MKEGIKKGNAFIVCAFLMMGILFYSSSQTYEQQSQVSRLEELLKNRPLEEQLQEVSFTYAGDEVSLTHRGYYKFVEFFVRKGAHFLTYFILSMCWFFGLEQRIKHRLLTGIVAWLCATGYAGLDEFHQMITGGRTPLFQDLMLDSVGALTAVLLCLLIRKTKKKKSPPKTMPAF